MLVFFFKNYFFQNLIGGKDIEIQRIHTVETYKISLSTMIAPRCRLIKNEGSVVQTCRNINVYVVNTDIC